MSDLSIKINIANRVYPLTIKREEEERIRRTAKMINDRIKQYENDYAVKDKQDLLAMCALEFGSSNEVALGSWGDSEEVVKDVRLLNEKIKEAIATL